jgi:hypothetical protein
MRSLIGLFGLICGAVVIWTVAQYGYASADDPAARWNTAFLFGVIAAGGLFGHAVAVRVGRVSKPWAVMIVMVCGAALVINLSNSLAALAGRNSRSAAESANQSRARPNCAPLLGQVGGREVDCDVLERQSEANGMQRVAHPLAALRHGFVGQTDDGEHMLAARDAHLHLHGPGLDADEGDRGDLPVHAFPRPTPDCDCNDTRSAEGQSRTN